MTVELIYESGCPNVADARANLLRAFSGTRLAAKWTEWDAASQDSPGRVRGFGSPSVLVDGLDVTGMDPAGSSCCRLYSSTNGGPTGVPPVELIRCALLKSGARRRPGFTTRTLAVLPGIGAALLPKLTCPMCWPAYAGILSTLGLSFLLSERYLLTVIALFLAVSVGLLAFRARRRRGYGPALAGLAASALTLLGKFQFNSTAAMYGGLALLAAASIWNGWPRKVDGSCARCVPAGADSSATQNAERREQ